MAIKKPLVISDSTGEIEELQTGDSISDSSPDTRSFTAGEDIDAGEVVYLSAANEVSLASASALSTMPAIGVAIETVTATNPISIQLDGTVTGLTGLTADQTLFVDTTAGALTTTIPSSSGQVVQRVGDSLSTTELNIRLGQPMRRG